MHYDHIRLSSNSQRFRDQRFRCEACGAREVVRRPISLASIEAQAAAFVAAHRDCPMRPAPNA